MALRGGEGSEEPGEGWVRIGQEDSEESNAGSLDVHAEQGEHDSVNSRVDASEELEVDDDDDDVEGMGASNSLPAHGGDDENVGEEGAPAEDQQPWRSEAVLNSSNVTLLNENFLLASQHALQAGADLYARETGDFGLENWTALHFAASRGKTATCARLVEYGLDANVGDAFNATPLHYAACRGRTSTCNTLVSLGSNLEAVTEPARYTPLHYAAMSKNKGTCVRLLCLGADIFAKNFWGQTPRDVALETKDEDTARTLSRLETKIELGQFRADDGRKEREEAWRQQRVAVESKNKRQHCDNDRVLVIRNLPSNTKEDDLREHFHKLGLQDPKRINLCLKRLSVGPMSSPKKCSAIVECFSAMEADQAVKGLNCTMFSSSLHATLFRIFASHYRPLQPEEIQEMEDKRRQAEASRLFVAGLNLTTSAQDLRSLFSAYGQVKEVALLQKPGISKSFPSTRHVDDSFQVWVKSELLS
ncbi:hypothetical protein GUITHDRAFT_116134 [Guillardia theta CCMP2712]|uniref:RRM domain-containing protein n=1 Tax=Guillardia theta (strain CCMP2712) TaxID=905079 RepID=L1INI6_GUITC|nr:hypothetical protein GUITHDRAFT_116134 [Guillardia theta CCMP2712]EKX37657.1 hypothetical protein GUITHDRAFT_116134 [Guillardia theta CCMP2712]|eukprot:XP_005824637.1 hypothetical protein GUITHDRAFT_116134 [Guillardia theta CCMP2712]